MYLRACSTAGNAPHSHCGDHRFDSGQVHYTDKSVSIFNLKKLKIRHKVCVMKESLVTQYRKESWKENVSFLSRRGP